MSLLTDIAEGLATLAFIAFVLVIADAVIHSPIIVWG